MKKNYSKVFLLIFCMLLISAVGNGVYANSGTQESASLSWQDDTSPFTFKQYFYGSWASNYIWKDQFAVKYIEDKTGVWIDRFLATGNDDDYLNILIAANDLPDSLMIDWNKPVVTKLINNDMVYSMNELIDKYCPEFWDMLDKEMVKYHSVNGKLWYLPNIYSTVESMKNVVPDHQIRPWFIRRDIYKAIGEPKLETPEDWLNAMKLVKEKYPNIVPLGLEKFNVNSEGFRGSRGMDFLIYAFAPDLNEQRIKDDQEIVEYPMRNEGFINSFRYLNKLYREGLFYPQFLIYKQEQYEEQFYGAKYFVGSAFTSNLFGKYNVKIKNTIGEDKTYDFYGVLKVNGKDPKYPYARLMGWQGFFISKNAKNPERIIKFAEYAWSKEGQLDFRYGKLGETYEMVDGLPQLKPELIKLKKTDSNAFSAKYGLEESTLLWRTGELWDKADKRAFIENYPDDYAAREKLLKYNNDVFGLGIDNIEPEGSTDEGVINAKIKDIWNKTIPKLLMSKSDAEFNQKYENFIVQIDKVGARKVEKVMYQKHIEELEKKGLY